MSEETIKQLTAALKENNRIISALQSDYCEGDEAAKIVGFKDKRYLKKLYDMNMLPRYERENGGFRYKKSDLHKIAVLLDSKEGGLSDEQKLMLYGGGK